MEKERVQLYINKNALEQFDCEAKNQGLSRTALIQLLVNQYLAKKGETQNETLN